MVECFVFIYYNQLESFVAAAAVTLLCYYFSPCSDSCGIKALKV